jgi:hypothetical protein
MNNSFPDFNAINIEDMNKEIKQQIQAVESHPKLES